jgi:uncharacterized protein (DUF1800 family)
VIETYGGSFKKEQAERLLWRAGFGPRRGEAEALARKGLNGAVRWLTRPGPERLVAPAPHDQDGKPIAPADAWGHDHVWWLDRMVRTSRPLTERMALVWHDWFATSNAEVGSQKLMLRQNDLFRRHALGSFSQLLLDVTEDPAMLLWLSGVSNTKDAPNENYGRELMELFTLGAGRGYTETDVREQARALTGFTYDWEEARGPVNFRFSRRDHDRGVKTIFGRRGRFTWRDSCFLCLGRPEHRSFFVEKLWSYFIPTPPDAGTRAGLEQLYARGRHAVRPVVEAILRHPALYEGQRMVKPPVVYTAGLLRARGRGIESTDWSWLAELSGQRLFYPPNVAGWDDSRWLDTSTFRGRWASANYVASKGALDEKARRPRSPQKLVNEAVGFWGYPALSESTRRALVDFARRALEDADEDWKRKSYPTLIENALRQLVATSPDMQTC